MKEYRQKFKTKSFKHIYRMKNSSSYDENLETMAKYQPHLSFQWEATSNKENELYKKPGKLQESKEVKLPLSHLNLVTISQVG